MVDCEIQVITKAQAGLLVAYMQELYSKPCPTIRRLESMPGLAEETAWIESKSHGAGVIFGAVADDKVIGLIDASVNTCYELSHVCTIGMSVLHGYRGKGVGRLLLEMVIGWASRVKLERVQLEVYDFNEAAIALYRSVGFKEEGRRVHGVRVGNDKRCDMVLMSLSLVDVNAAPDQV